MPERHEKKYKIEYSKSFNVFERLLCRKLKIIMRINNARAYFKLARNKNNNTTTMMMAMAMNETKTRNDRKF